MSFSAITLHRLERASGDFRAQLPGVNTIRWALDFGFLKDRYEEDAKDLLKCAATALLVGVFDDTNAEFVGLVKRVDDKLATVEGREGYLRFLLKYLHPCAFDNCLAHMSANKGDVTRKTLLLLAQPYMGASADGTKRPVKWVDKSAVCKAWLGLVVGDIEASLGGKLEKVL